MPDRDPSKPPPPPAATMRDVQAFVDRAQRLADTRPSGRYSAAWFIEAQYIGDLGAIGALAALAARHSLVPDGFSNSP